MYGYQPPPDDNEDQTGSWREVLVMIRVAFEVLAMPLAILFGALVLMMGLLFALFTEPIFALIPLAVIGLGFWLLIRRDKRIQAEMENEINRDYPYR